MRNSFITYELILAVGRMGKITFNKRKIHEEIKIHTLQSKLIRNKKLIKFEPKELTTTIDKFCILHKLDLKQKTRVGKIL